VWKNANNGPYDRFVPWRSPMASRARELCGFADFSSSSTASGVTDEAAVVDELLGLLWAQQVPAALQILQQLASAGKHRGVLALLAIYERAGLRGEEGAGAPTEPTASPLFDLYERNGGLLKREMRAACTLVEKNLSFLSEDPHAASWFDLYRRAAPSDDVVWAHDARTSVASVAITVAAANATLTKRDRNTPFLTPLSSEDLKLGIQHGLARVLSDPSLEGIEAVKDWA